MNSTSAKNKKVFDGRYEILGIVGRGRKSVVYHARNIVDGGPEVALKVLISDKDSTNTRDKLRKEALAMVSCHHRYVVRLDDFHSVGELSYLSMEYAPESDLRKYVNKKGGKLTEAQTEKFLLQAARAIDYIHSVGIIHRDIKPDNILVISDDEIRIGDFGIALLPGDEQLPDEYRNAIGTMDYMAPEILEGRPCDARTDLYALGLTAAEIASGKVLFANIPLAEQLSARESEKLPQLTIEDKRLKSAISKLITFESTDRFKNAKDLITFLTTPFEENPVVIDSIDTTNETKSDDDTSVTREVDITSIQEPKSEERAEIKESSEDVIPEAVNKVTQLEPDKIVSSIAETQLISSTAAKDLFEEAPRSLLVKSGVLGNILNRLPAILIFIAASLLILKIFSYLFIGSKNDSEIVTDQPSVIETIDIRAASHDGVIDLALLPSGVYKGYLTGVHPVYESVPFYLISDLEHAKLIVIIGIEGWAPAVIQTTDKNLQKLRLASGGISFELNKLTTNDGLQVNGTLKNLTLGGEGVVTFSVQGTEQQ